MRSARIEEFAVYAADPVRCRDQTAQCAGCLPLHMADRLSPQRSKEGFA